MKVLQLFICLSLLSACNFGGLIEEAKDLEFNATLGGENIAASRAAFATTIYPIVSNCATCHSGSGEAPNFSLGNSDGMHDIFLGQGIIIPSTDTAVISANLVVVKVGQDLHNCGGATACDALADQLKAAIAQWAQAAATGSDNLGKHKTASVVIADSLTPRLPEVYRKTIMFHAEDLNGTGGDHRWKIEDHPTAFGKKMITTRDPAPHPIDLAPRTSSIDVNARCQTIDSYNSGKNPTQINIDGAVRYNEGLRHPNQAAGSLPYRQELKAAIIDPRKREEFATFIAANPDATIGQVAPYLLTDGEIDPEDRDDFDIDPGGNNVLPIPLMYMVPWERLNGSDGSDNNISFVDSERYQNRLPNGQVNQLSQLNIQTVDYFTQNWGGSLGTPFSAHLNHSKIASMLPQRELRRRIYREIYQYYFTRFFDTDGTARNSVNSIPLFEAIPAPTTVAGVEIFSFEPGVFPPVAVVDPEDQAERFLKYWMYNDNPDSLKGGAGDNIINEIKKFAFFFVETDVENGDFSYDLYNDNSNYSGATPVLRNFSSVSNLTQNFNLNFGNTNLDLTNILLSNNQDNVDLNAIKDNFVTHLFPLIQQGSATLGNYQCANCHGDNGPQPAWAHSNSSQSYSVNVNYAATVLDNTMNPFVPSALSIDGQIGMPNFRILDRLVNDRHNCGSAAQCDALAEDIAEGYNAWHAANQPLFQSTPPSLQSLPAEEREPGRAWVEFKVNEPGNYALWIKFLTRNNEDQEVRARILDDQGRPVNFCKFNENCPTTNATFQGLSALEIDRMNCDTGQEFDQDGLGNNYWYWWVNSYQDFQERRGWQLEPGTYRLEIIEFNTDSAEIDSIALSANPAFDPKVKVSDEVYFADVHPRSIEYDISQFNGQSNSKVRIDVDIKDDAYIIKNPTIISNGQSSKVAVLRLLLNESFDFSNSTYLTINEVTEYDRDNGADILTSTKITALKLANEAVDRIGLSFEILEGTNDDPTDNTWTAPPDGVEIQCLYPDIFAKIVAPILDSTNVMLFGAGVNDGYDDVVGRFPGKNGNDDDSQNPNHYFCIDCHDSNHPEFPMTIFAGQGTDILCGQVLSKSLGSVEPLDDLLIFKGILGYPGHPSVDIIQRKTPWNTQFNREYVFESDNPGDFEWQANNNEYDVLQAYEKYTSSEVNSWIAAHNWDNNQDDYCREWIGQPKRIRFQRYNDNNNDFDNEIMAAGDIVRVPTEAETQAPDPDAIPDPIPAGPLYYEYLLNPSLKILERSNPETYNLDDEVVICADIINGVQGGGSDCVEFNGSRDNVPNGCLAPKFMGTGGIQKSPVNCYDNANTVCTSQQARDIEKQGRSALEQVYIQAIKEWVRLELQALGAL